MQNNFSTENLNVGDKVIVICINWSSRSEYVGEVIKKTPTGLVDVIYIGGKVHRFKKTGENYNKRDYYSRIYIEEYTEERAEIIRKHNRRIGILKFLVGRDWDTYKDAELEQIYNFVKGLRST